MNNELISNGLNIISVDPPPYSPNVIVNKSICIQFNGGINKNTLYGNVYLLEDINKVYTNNKIIDVNLYNQVPITFGYGDQTLMLTPKDVLNINSLYIIYIPGNTIKGVLGNKMVQDYISYFFTETEATLSAPNIIYPLDNSVNEYIECITWNKQNAFVYVIEISKSINFEHLVLSEFLFNSIPDSQNNISYRLDGMRLLEGLYYIRVKAINGIYNTPIKCFIKNTNIEPISIDDSQYIDVAEEVDDDLIVEETFPSNNGTSISTSVNVIYFKFNRILNSNEISSIKCSINGELSDSQDEENNLKRTHGEINTIWNVINDYQINKSYLVCNLPKI